MLAVAPRITIAAQLFGTSYSVSSALFLQHVIGDAGKKQLQAS